MKNFFNGLHPKTQFLFSAIMAVVLVVALAWFSFFFLWERVRWESAEIEAAKIRRASLEARRNETKREEALSGDLRADVDRIESVFVQEPLPFFEFLENLALRNNLSIALALDARGGDADRTDRLRVTVGGDYKSIVRFVRSIESAPHATEISSVSLSLANQRVLFSDSLASLNIDLRIIQK
jgi:Tfp pilus assembly protein PilO